ncbi:MAG: monofunctional biosynthetic peptidoglycan transglycosylase [Pseudomonadota bacterium]
MATTKSKTRKAKKKRTSKKSVRWKLLPFFRRSWRELCIRTLVAVVCLFIVLPAGLLLLYRVEAVHPVSTLMLRESIVGSGARRDWVELEEVAPVLYQSVLMSEDGQFCNHGGIDWNALNQVIDDAIEGERTRGASTITMQLVKNLFLWPDRSFIRKGLEVPYALMAEQILGKRRIMEIYLNIAEWDTGVFGIEAASQHYFNRPAAKLGPRFSSLLAVTLPNPKSRNPAKPSRKMSSLARIIRARARASGAYIKCLSQAE